ncbi:MAG: ABC transporter ATP-binding protein [Prevotella sp.]|jgi:ABC-2 type transport system ATP-binding protein|nr:ABC transporter ATP-binding protein [Prevotella sp.]
MIEVKGVSKKIKGNMVLKDLDLAFSEGETYLLSGHNGSGKTMLLRALCGLIKPTIGDVVYTKDYSFGVIIENPSFMDGYTGWENLSFLASLNKQISSEAIEKIMRRLNLYQYKDEKVRKYSLGMKQKLGICQAIMENQDVILLDEPFNALDAESHQIVKDLLIELKGQNKIIIIAAHGTDVETKSLFDKIIVMDSGKIASVSPAVENRQ